MISKRMKKGGDILIQRNKSDKKPYATKVNGENFKVLPNVFSPKYFLDPAFFVSNIPNQKEKIFLEIGSGTGVMAINVALQGAKRVIAVDINPHALENTEENAKLHKVSDRIEVIKSNVYNGLSKTKKYDSIFWNVPFGQIKRKRITLLERALYDLGYANLRRYIHQAPRFLKPKGKLYIGFSSNIGDTEVLFDLLRKNNFRWKIIAETSFKMGHPGGPVKFELLEATLKK